MGYRAAGRTAEAIPLLERTLADYGRMLGADHPKTKAARKDLAALTGEPERTGTQTHRPGPKPVLTLLPICRLRNRPPLGVRVNTPARRLRIEATYMGASGGMVDR